MNQIETLNLMLDVLKKINDLSLNDEATTAIHHGLELLHRKQKKRPWVGLTDKERGHVYLSWRFNGSNSSDLELCRAIEAKLKEKNT